MKASGGSVLRKHDGNLTVNGSLDSGLKTLVERAAKRTGASYAFLLLCAHDTRELYNVAWYGHKEASENCAPIALWVLSRGESICLRGEAEARKIVGSSPGQETLPLICAPVMTNATLHGVLGIGSPHSAGKEFSCWLPLLESLGELAGALLEIASLKGNILRKDEQLRNLIKDALDAQEAERERICLEVHDGVAQTLVSAFQYLQTMKTRLPEDTPARQLLLRTRALLEQAIQELRAVINSLQPATLRELGLIATLRQEIRQLECEAGWEVDFDADVTRLPEYIETGLYRIIHEAITNARRHADTNRLRVRITTTNDQVKAEVRDWGTGFYYNPENMLSGQSSGLLSMSKRAKLLQGSCKIQSNPGQGTTVRVKIPVIIYRGERE